MILPVDARIARIFGFPFNADDRPEFLILLIIFDLRRDGSRQEPGRAGEPDYGVAFNAFDVPFKRLFELRRDFLPRCVEPSDRSGARIRRTSGKRKCRTDPANGPRALSPLVGHGLQLGR